MDCKRGHGELKADQKKENTKEVNERVWNEMNRKEDVGRWTDGGSVSPALCLTTPSVMGVYFNTWGHHKQCMHVFIWGLSLFSPSLSSFSYITVFLSPFVWFSFFSFLPLTLLNKHTWCLVTWGHTQVLCTLPIARTTLDQFFASCIQSSYIPVFLPLCMCLCSVFLHVHFTHIVVTNTVVETDVQPKGI